VPLVSPNDDGVADAQALSYRLSRPSAVTVELTRPDGSVALTESGQREAGIHSVPFPPASTADSTAEGVAEGRWSLRIEATDDLARASSMTRTFVVDTTLGFLRVPARAAVPSGGRPLAIRWRLLRGARVVVTVEDEAGRTVRRLLARELEQGEQSVTWNGLGAKGGRLAGRFVVRVAAASSVGVSELVDTVVLRRA
jgi:hypothetical protein